MANLIQTISLNNSIAIKALTEQDSVHPNHHSFYTTLSNSHWDQASGVLKAFDNNDQCCCYPENDLQYIVL